MVSPAQPLYMSRAHREALAALEWGLYHEPSGFTLLIGEPGTGKTTLLGRLFAQSHYQIRMSMISNPPPSFDELLPQIIRQFGIAAGASRREIFDALDRFLATIEPGGRVAIIIDEAQVLSQGSLEEIRLFSNRGSVEEKQLHFILVGQPKLARRLRDPDMVQLNDRIGARAVLERMSRAESFEYVAHCLRTGDGNARRIFHRRALARLVDHGGGLPRRLNVLCHNAMLLAYSAGRHQVSLRDARTAADEYANLFVRKFRLEDAIESGRRFWRRPSISSGAA
jgi:general secretion pathway protein A